jgi:hypothetical protein
MTTSIMTRAAARATGAAANPEYACGQCNTWHTGSCPGVAEQQLGNLLTRIVREADTRIPAGRRARRTLQEMVPGYERQPVLVLHRPSMLDWCPLCESYHCDPANCPPASAGPAPVTANFGLQCAVCGGRFNALPGPAVGWTCDACKNNGH